MRKSDLDKYQELEQLLTVTIKKMETSGKAGPDELSDLRKVGTELAVANKSLNSTEDVGSVDISTLVPRERSDSEVDGNPNNPADTPEKLQKLAEDYDYVDPTTGKGWNLKMSESMAQLTERARRNSVK